MATTQTVTLSNRLKATLTFANGTVTPVFDPPLYDKNGGRYRPSAASLTYFPAANPSTPPGPENREMSALDDDEFMRLNMATVALLAENGAITADQAKDVGRNQTRSLIA